MMISF